MNVDKSPFDRFLDVALFAPAGLAITLGEEFPKLVDKGRHRVEGQVHTARLVGQFAVQLGRRQLEQWASRPEGDAAAGPASTGIEGPADDRPPTASGADLVDITAANGAGPSTHATGATAGTEGSGGVGGPFPATHLAIPGYDSLSASQVVQRLDGLSSAELADVRAHERASRGRRTILSRIEQLLAGAPPGPA